ncbi:hypothetical protein [Saccharopolyspora hattusasensis]|uniref:hypothetical protein n=1 Tax=Saccharopolyspora hattusasensis TaxID=1128679 RepID=UPI003D97F0C9
MTIVIPVDAELAASPAGHELDDIAALLPEQEWCDNCSLHEDGEPGMPRDVVDCSIEPLPLSPSDWDLAWEHDRLYEITYLSCGHTIVRLA